MSIIILREDFYLSNGPNTKSRTMGSTSSRKILCSTGEPPEGKSRPLGRIGSFFKVDRLVCDELCEDAQCVIRQPREVCDSVPLLQKPPQSVQQKNVRSFLPMPPNQVR